MTAAEKHIRHFNKMNGKPVKKETLVRFLKKLPNDPALDELRGKLELAISKVGSGATLKFTPLEFRRVTSSPTDVSLLHGIENIQNDADFKGTALDGLSDTTYQVITDRILELMKDNGLMWRKPWNADVSGPSGLAQNYVTKHVYRGGNYYLNYLQQFKLPYFFTFKQVSDLGGKVKKGEKGWPVVYFKWLYKDIAKNKLVPEQVAVENGKVKSGFEKIPGLFYYMVFNYDQTEGLKVKPVPVKKRSHKEIIESAERIISEMPKRPELKNGPDAWYSPAEDLVQVPKLDQFKIDQHYYSVFFHELVHSTGHSKRVSRDLTGHFGSKKYAFEELIAELGASFLCGESGILYFTMKNSAAYIKNWSSKLREEMTADPKFFLRAAAQAQKAADFMLAVGEYSSLKKHQRKTKASSKRDSKKIRVPMKRERNQVTASAGRKPAAALAGFTTADKAATPANTFRLPGNPDGVGDFLQNLQRYKLIITIAGETHSSKSELGKQIADAFISAGDDVAWIDWEQGGLQSRDTVESINRNVKPQNRKHLHVTSELPKSLEAVKDLAKKFKVIVLDSGTSLKLFTNTWMDELRVECPDTVFIILMQLNASGRTRGGVSAEFDMPVVIYTYRPDWDDHTKNYAKLFKNRGNKTGLEYNISAKKIMRPASAAPAPVPQEKEEIVI